MRGISWLAAKTGQLLKKDSAPWSKLVCAFIRAASRYTVTDSPNQYFSNTPHSRKNQGLTYRLYQTSRLFGNNGYLQVSCELLNERRREEISDNQQCVPYHEQYYPDTRRCYSPYL
jgi:hypothetical protein